MGFGLLGSCYLNGDFLRELAIKTGGRPKYSAREGSVIHDAAYELMHGYLSDAYGYFASRSLPDWKVKGYCEYGVNQLTAITHRPHYIWGLVMEFLINVKRMSLEQVMAESVTREDACQGITDWREGLKSSSQP